MNATVSHRGSATTVVVVEEIPQDATDDAVLESALVAARETRSSLFGWVVNRNGSPTATVDLWTD